MAIFLSNRHPRRSITGLPPWWSLAKGKKRGQFSRWTVAVDIPLVHLARVMFSERVEDGAGWSKLAARNGRLTITGEITVRPESTPPA